MTEDHSDPATEPMADHGTNASGESMSADRRNSRRSRQSRGLMRSMVVKAIKIMAGRRENDDSLYFG